MLLDVGDRTGIAVRVVAAVPRLERDDPALEGGLPVGEAHHVDLRADLPQLRPGSFSAALLELVDVERRRPRTG